MADKPASPVANQTAAHHKWRPMWGSSSAGLPALEPLPTEGDHVVQGTSTVTLVPDSPVESSPRSSRARSRALSDPTSGQEEAHVTLGKRQSPGSVKSPLPLWKRLRSGVDTRRVHAVSRRSKARLDSPLLPLPSIDPEPSSTCPRPTISAIGRGIVVGDSILSASQSLFDADLDDGQCSQGGPERKRRKSGEVPVSVDASTTTSHRSGSATLRLVALCPTITTRRTSSQCPEMVRPMACPTWTPQKKCVKS